MTRTGALIFIVTPIALLLAGCGGGNDRPDARRATAGASAASADALPGPAYDADAEAVAEFVQGGQWRLVLLPEAAGTAGLRPPAVSARFEADGLDSEAGGGPATLQVAGRVADADVTRGRLAVTPGGAALPRLRFTTEGLTVPGLLGEPMTVPGPVRWEAELYRGRFVGTATGPDGRANAWEATRPR